jgi:hypothetical protein
MYGAQPTLSAADLYPVCRMLRVLIGAKYVVVTLSPEPTQVWRPFPVAIVR